MIRNFLRNEKGAALLEYALLASGVALISAAGVAIFGHKTNDMISSVAAIMPGAHDDDNGPILSGKLIETAANVDGNIAIDVQTIIDNTGNFRLGDNLGVDNLQGLIIEG